MMSSGLTALIMTKKRRNFVADARGPLVLRAGAQQQTTQKVNYMKFTFKSRVQLKIVDDFSRGRQACTEATYSCQGRLNQWVH